MNEICFRWSLGVQHSAPHWQTIASWQPDKPAWRQSLQTIVDDANHKYGEGTHWIAHREQPEPYFQVKRMRWLDPIRLW